MDTACPRCGAVGRAVGEATIRAMLEPSVAAPVHDGPRWFCRTRDCGVLYYGEAGRIINKGAARVRVGAKETDDPIPLCYCFGFDRRDVLADPTIESRIAEEIRAGRCACETKNPSGACCLGDVRSARR